MPTLIVEFGRVSGSTGILGETLREYGQRLSFVELANGAALPDDLDGIDAIVVGDGPQTLVAGAPAWAGPLTALIATAYGRQLPIVGLGLGSRVLAMALGGELAATDRPQNRDGEGKDGAWASVRLTPVGREDTLYRGVAWTAEQVVVRSERIAKLPTAGVTLASGSSGAILAFSAGVFAFGFEHQWWLDDERFDRLAGETAGSADSLRAGWKTHGETSRRIGRRIAESIALCLMPVDRMNAGRVKDLHY